MRNQQALAATVLVALGCAAGFLGGQRIRTPTAGASTSHHYTLRLGDKATIPAIRQVCRVEAEAGSVELFCGRSRNAHHQVVIFRNSMFVYSVGNPDHPAWAGKP